MSGKWSTSDRLRGKRDMQVHKVPAATKLRVWAQLYLAAAQDRPLTETEWFDCAIETGWLAGILQ